MIIYGTQYYRPPFPNRSSWKSDLLKIKEVNFNTVKLWAVWSWIERKEGEYYFEDLDTIVDLCQEIGLQVVINTIPEGMPYWLSRRHPDAKFKISDNSTVEMSGAANMPSGGSPGLCSDKREVQKTLCDFISKVVDRYAARENIIAFDVWNEPHLEPIFDFPDQLFCYCDHSKQCFVEWLIKKYQSIESLNTTWMRAYESWEDVYPPVRYGTYPDMIDWRLFWIENLGNWLDARVEAAKRAARGKTVMTHVPFSGYVGGSGEGGLGYHLGDEFILAPKVDKFGLTSFPKWLMGNDFVQHLVNLELVAASSQNKDFWQSELQAGAGKWEAYGRSVATPEEIRMWNWSAITCGAKGVMYWQWRPEPSGMEALGFGLTLLDGTLSPRTQAAAQCALVFNRPGGFDRARQVPIVNGIYVSRNTDLWWHAASKGEPLYAKSLYGAYRACFEEGIPVRMVHADHLAGIRDEDLKVLYLPAAVALSGEELVNLQNFVARGGTLVSEACPGLFDEHGVIREDLSFLDQVFGISGQIVDHHDQVRVQYAVNPNKAEGSGNIVGRYYRQDFQIINPAVNTIAHFEDHRPAMFENCYGDGRAILVGTFVGIAAGSGENQSSVKFITRWMKPSGYELLDELAPGEGSFVRLHLNDRMLYITAVNYGELVQKNRLKLKGSYRVVEGGASCRLEDDKRSLEFSVDQKDGAIITLEAL